jgi:hypothetical protein
MINSNHVYITFMGGEPYAYKDLRQMVEYCKEKTPNTPLRIFSNLKWLSHADESHYQWLHDNNILLIYTYYTKPIMDGTIDYVRFRELIQKYDIQTNDMSGKGAILMLYSLSIKQPGRCNFLSFKYTKKEPSKVNNLTSTLCCNADVVKLFRGKIYTLTCGPAIDQVDKKYGTDYASKLIENCDWYDVHKLNNFNEIQRKHEFCAKHCKLCSLEPWEQCTNAPKEDYILDS